MSFIRRVAGLFAGGAVRPFADALASGFAPLAEIGPAVPKRAADFVLSGDDSAVLLELTNAKRRANILALRPGWYGDRDTKHLAALYRLLRDDAFCDGPRLARLGSVFAATEATPLDEHVYPGSDRSPAGFRILMFTAAYSHRIDGTSDAGSDCGALTVDRCSAALAVDGADISAVFDVALRRDPERYAAPLGHRLAGFATLLAHDPATVARVAPALDSETRITLCELIRAAGATIANLDTLVRFAVGPAKGVREAATRAIAGTSREPLVAAVEPIFAAKAIEPQLHAIALLAHTLGSDAAPILEGRLAAGPAKKVADALRLHLSASAVPTQTGAPSDAEAGGYTAVDGTFVDLPPQAELPADTAFAAELRPLVRNAVAEMKAYWSTSIFRGPGPNPFERSAADALIAIADGAPGGGAAELAQLDRTHTSTAAGKAFAAFLADSRLTLWHVLRIYLELERYPPHPLPLLTSDQRYSQSGSRLKARIVAETPDLRTITLLVEPLGYDAAGLARTLLLREDWDDVDPAIGAIVWPFLATQPGAFEEVFGVGAHPSNRTAGVESALAALAVLPKAPQRLLAPLMRIAITGGKAERHRARELIATAPALDSAIAALLGDGKQETRADAARWLADRDARAHIPALRAALAAEKSDTARAAYLSALSKLGDDISPFVDQSALLEAARAGLRKTGLRGLEWFPFDGLPALHWADGTPIAPEIVRWWIVLANKLAEPAGNPLFELYFDRMRPGDPAAFGLAVIALFIERDTAHPPESEAIAYAQANVDSSFAAQNAYDKTITREMVYGRLKSSILAHYVSTMAPHRGILALAVRATGAEAAAKVRMYLKHNGGRTSQAKALLATLAANPAPAAIQLVVATADRFRQRTVQEFAAQAVASIAGSRGWTADELADNTIPTAGFGDDGGLELDCGPDRLFSAVLDAAGKLALRNAQGKPVTALPAPRNAADDAPLKEAKRVLATAKKEIAQVRELQTQRLFEAMCFERAWPAADWRRLFAGHPIVGGMCARLVWLAVDANGSIAASFRPLDDGTLSGPADESVELDPALRVKLAHRAIVGEADTQRWIDHLRDYDVTPLFEQFSRPVLTLAANSDREKLDCVADRHGWLIESQKLRAAAAKRHFEACPAEDGGIFSEFIRRHRSAGLQVAIGFSGARPGGERTLTALWNLTFARVGRRSATVVPLAQVPPVLLSESWNDLHEIAASGSGYDPKWQDKITF